jgi:ABC-2 type transport system permease protein
MNLKGGIALIKKSLFSYVASKGFFWTLAVSWLMGPLVFLFVWLAAAGDGSIDAFSRQDFIAYYLCLILVNQLTYPSSHWTVGENILIGTMSTWLLRPLPVLYEAMASDVALKIVCMPFVLVIAAALGWLLGFSAPLSPAALPLFLLMLLLACSLRFLFAYSLALLAFWTQRISALLALMDTIAFLFAGLVAPTVLLPGVLQNIAFFLPFRYMIAFPIEYLLGKLSPEAVLIGLAYQIGWLLLTVLANRLIWVSGIRHYSAIGG